MLALANVSYRKDQTKSKSVWLECFRKVGDDGHVSYLPSTAAVTAIHSEVYHQ